jgi:hypothetical protein
METTLKQFVTREPGRLIGCAIVPLQLPNCRFDDADSCHQTSWLYRNRFEAKISVSYFVTFLKVQHFFEADLASFGMRYEARIANEE